MLSKSTLAGCAVHHPMHALSGVGSKQPHLYADNRAQFLKWLLRMYYCICMYAVGTLLSTTL